MDCVWLMKLLHFQSMAGPKIIACFQENKCSSMQTA